MTIRLPKKRPNLDDEEGKASTQAMVHEPYLQAHKPWYMSLTRGCVFGLITVHSHMSKDMHTDKALAQKWLLVCVLE